MIVAKVDRDYINTNSDGTDIDSELPSRVGKTFELTELGLGTIFPETSTEGQIESLKVRFRCLDDDDIIYYGGWLYNDNACEVQLTVLAWAMADAGCTTIEVHYDRAKNWIQEVG